MATGRARAGTRPRAGQTEAFKAAVAALDENGAAPDEVTLANGVRLKLRSVPPLFVRKAVSHLERPKPPRVHLEEKGREEENPNDPDYIAALEEYGQKTFDAGANVMLAMGVSVLEVPDGMSKPEDEDWVELLEAAGFEPDVHTEAARRLSWLSYYAITSEHDVIKIVLGVSRLTGVGEQEVAAAMEGFRGRAVRPADSDVPSAAAGDGDHV